MSPRRTYKEGFTLLELLLAVAILAMIALMMARIFAASSEAVERGKRNAMLDEAARLLLDTIERDVGQAVLRTNIPLRVHSVAGFDALYFVSPGVRRATETMPRDTAPMRIRLANTASALNGLVPDWNWHLVVESAIGTTNTLDKLIRSSDYYATNAAQAVADFMPARGGAAMGRSEAEYTLPLETLQGTENHVMPTFVDFNINGDPDSNVSASAMPEVRDLPRFVDVVLGLAASSDIAQAMRLHAAQGAEAAEAYLQKHERIYARRIPIRNTGILPPPSP